MALFENPVKRMVKDGRRTAGAWLQMCSPMSAEIMGAAGFDWLLIDMEHGPNDITTILAQMQALSGSGTTVFVRAPWNDLVTIKRILDTGAHGILVPYVNSRVEAEAAVRASKYPPQGLRGVAGSPRAAGYGHNSMDYLSRANDEVAVLIAIETAKAVDNLDEILTVVGLDGIFIGPMDLASSMGYLGDPGRPEVKQVIAGIEEKVFASDKFLVTVSTSWEGARALYERGYRMVTLMADGVALGKMAREMVARFHEAYPQR